MTVFHVVDTHLVPESEYRSKRKDLASFVNARAGGRARDGFSIAGTELSTTEHAGTKPDAVSPEPIGKGKPLTILIKEVYTGQYPDGGLFNDRGDMALVSAVKNYDVFNASARALNFIVKNVKKNSRLARPTPFSDGTSLVAYSPAVVTDSLTIGFEFGFASFTTDFLDSISKIFGSVASIPLLLPYKGFVMGAGEVFKIGSSLSHALFDGAKAVITDAINFDVWGEETTPAGFLICSPSNKLRGYSYSSAKGMLDTNGKPYNGDTPYVVISLDGKERDNLKAFSPTVASAAVLQRFFSVEDGTQASIDTIVDGLQFVSDSKYRKQAVSLKEKLANPALDAARKAKLQEEYDATVKNILNDSMKP